MNDEHLDACLGLVAEGERRRIIQRLRRGPDGETSIEDLVDRLSGSEPVTVSGGSGDRDRIHLQLVHTHLPKLADHGVVEYDRESGTVRYRSHEVIEAVLDSIPGEAVPTTR